MKEYIVKLKQKKEVAKSTWKFTFERPSDLKFQAGQYTFLEIIEKRFEDDRPNFRAMSFCSAPKDDFIEFTMRESESAFKKNITLMQIGEKIKIKDPLGNFILPEDKDIPIVFLTAGVGITPVRSILKQEEFEKSDRKITLFHSNQAIETAVYYEEMEKISLKNYRCINTMTRDCTGWNGECNRINDEMLNKYLDEVKNSLYYVVGTKQFIDAMRKILQEMDVKDENIVFDNFG